MTPTAGLLLLSGMTLVVLVAALLCGVGDAGADSSLRWALAFATLVVHLSGAVTAGSLVTALLLLRPATRAFEVAMNLAAASAAALAVSAAVGGVLVFAAEGGEQGFGTFFTQTVVGLAWLTAAVAGVVLATLLLALRSRGATVILAALAIAALIPVGVTAGGEGWAARGVGATSLVLCMIGIAVWFGGLVLLVVVRSALTAAEAVTAATRYRKLAPVACAVVLVTGMVVVADRIRVAGAPSGTEIVFTAVGAAALVSLGVLGLFSGRATHPRRPRLLVSLELTLAGIASGSTILLAVAPCSSVQTASTDPATYLTGSPLPSEPDALSWLLRWYLDPVWAIAVVAGLALYLAGVRRVRRRGEVWPRLRAAAWTAGMLVLLWLTCGPVAVYEDYLVSVQLFGQAMLMTGVPLLLVTGSPLRLALRAVPPRGDGTFGGHEWIAWAGRSRPLRLIAHPVSAALLCALLSWAFLATDLFRWSLYDRFGHEWSVVLFLVIGCLFVRSMIGADPLTRRFPSPWRLVTLVVVLVAQLAAVVVFGGREALLAAEWYGSMGRTWGVPPLVDQHVGVVVSGVCAVALSVILAVVIVRQGRRDRDTATRRPPRRSDRARDEALDAYNASLTARADADPSGGRGGIRHRSLVPPTRIDTDPSESTEIVPLTTNGTSSETSRYEPS